MRRILIHTCCAHCLGQTLAGLAAEPEAYEPVVFWGNPNIHPLIEWRRRLKAVKMLVDNGPELILKTFLIFHRDMPDLGPFALEVLQRVEIEIFVFTE